MYSPRTRYPDGEALQTFTAIGVVSTGQVYQVEMTDDFKPYRLDVAFLKTREAPIKPLVNDLSFISSKTRWGAAFRFGQIKIPAKDFRLIAKAMGVESAFRGDALEQRISPVGRARMRSLGRRWMRRWTQQYGGD